MRGFTLVELLVATLITGLLLGGLALVIHQVSQADNRGTWDQFSARYERAADVIGADVRGLVRVTPLNEIQSKHGRLVASFVTTHRLDATADQRWRGSARVSYWVEPTASGGQRLWRHEQLRGADENEARSDQTGTWAPMLSQLQQVQWQLLVEDKWQSWPKQANEQTNKEASEPDSDEAQAPRCEAVRFQLRRRNPSGRSQPLPGLTLQPMAEATVESTQ